MRRCSGCDQELASSDTTCPECGLEASGDSLRAARDGFAYSHLAGMALVVGEIAAAILCLLAVLDIGHAVLEGSWMKALVRGPLELFVTLAILVVLIRSQDHDRKR